VHESPGRQINDICSRHSPPRLAFPYSKPVIHFPVSCGCGCMWARGGLLQYIPFN